MNPNPLYVASAVSTQLAPICVRASVYDRYTQQTGEATYYHLMYLTTPPSFPHSELTPLSKPPFLLNRDMDNH